MSPNYDGATLLDSAGEQIGTIQQSYLDASGGVRFLDVKLGALIGRHHLVPADGAQVTEDGVRIPYLKAVIEESPVVEGGDTLEGDALANVSRYYSQEFDTLGLEEVGVTLVSPTQNVV